MFKYTYFADFDTLAKDATDFIPFFKLPELMEFFDFDSDKTRPYPNPCSQSF
ncbi:MAG: hypothetical protein P0S95_00490 [Rhabdochlamydiaceae bacterium]|nr:hypothetical protein [Candidatus Amphrikana amoebophyrae]